MFLGEYSHTIDNKGRLTIPAKFRGFLAAGVVVTRGFDQNLMAFTLEGWQELAERVNRLPMADPNAREFRRRVFSGAVDLVPDRQGRILIPPYLREFARIDTEVVITGNFNYAEIWSRELWQPMREVIESEPAADRWQALGI